MPRAQRWGYFLSAHQYVLKYRHDAVNANADVLSRLPVATEKENPDSAITYLHDVEVCFVGGSGVYRRYMVKFIRSRRMSASCPGTRALLCVGSYRASLAQAWVDWPTMRLTWGGGR